MASNPSNALRQVLADDLGFPHVSYMAGIAGWVDWKRDLRSERATAERMADTLAHRGPDGLGVFASPRAVFAHRRVARLEAEQPLVRADATGRYVVVLDGSIDNEDELRQELASLDPSVTCASQADIVLHGYRAWKHELFARLGGSFAVAIWDEQSEQLLLARDRLGIAPLYYVLREGCLLFGSEPKALLAHPSVVPELDENGLAELFAARFTRTPGAVPFRGMHELVPAHWLAFDRKGARLVRYWQPRTAPHRDDLETTAATVRRLLEDAVARRLPKEEKPCTLLSGGLDSSAITAFASRKAASPSEVDAYAVEMKGAAEWFVPTAIQPELDSEWARKTADALGITYRVLTLDSRDVLDAFYEPLAIRDLPSMGEMDVSLYLLCREIKKTHDVVLSGESADELFGGYPFFFDEKAVAADTFPWLVQTVTHDPNELLRPDLKARIRPEDRLREAYRKALAEAPDTSALPPEERRMREVFHLVLTRFLPNLLERKDRMSMAWGLRARMPFSDHRLHEYLWNVPWEMKAYGGREKGILRKALTGLLPDDVLWRKKSGYPSMHDPSFTRAVQKRLAERLDDPASPLNAIVDVSKVRARLERSAADPSAGGIGGEAQLFSYLLHIDEWLRRYRVRLLL